MPEGSSTTPRMQQAGVEPVDVSPPLPKTPPAPRPPPSAVPSAEALKRMLQQESPAEVALVRRGEEAALARINHLKAVNANHERNLALHTSALAAQHELLHDVTAKVAALARALPKPQQQQQSPRGASEPPWEAVYTAVLQLHHRLQRGAGGKKE